MMGVFPMTNVQFADQARATSLLTVVCAFGLASIFAGCDRSAPAGNSTASGGVQPATGAPVDTADEASEPAGEVIPGVGYALPAKVGKYEVLGIRTDNKDQAAAKANAEACLVKYPDVACMVGLWAPNPPACLSALQARNLDGKVKIVGFDEHPETLAAIRDGKIHGTIVQQPYLFGFKSVEYLAALARGEGDKIAVPDDKIIFVPHSIITADNVQDFAQRVEAMNAGTGPTPDADRTDYDLSKPVKLMYLTNSIDPFWVLAQRGVEKGNVAFKAECEVNMPSDGSTEKQKAAVEQFINRGGQGLAISPIDPANQGGLINEAAAKMPVICQDSDAPGTDRLFYIGTSNYMAGRSAGKLVKQAIPDGGRVMIFVGKLEVLNAQERSRGVIDELFDKPLPEAFVGQEY